MKAFGLIFIIVVGLLSVGCNGNERNGVYDPPSKKPTVDKNGKPPVVDPPTSEEKAVHGILITLAVISLLGIVAGGVMMWISPAKKMGAGLSILSTAVFFFALSLGRNLEKWENWFNRGLMALIMLAIVYAVLTHIRKLKTVIKEIEAEVKN